MIAHLLKFHTSPRNVQIPDQIYDVEGDYFDGTARTPRLQSTTSITASGNMRKLLAEYQLTRARTLNEMTLWFSDIFATVDIECLPFVMKFR